MTDYSICIKVNAELYDEYIERLRKYGITHQGRYADVGRVNKAVIELSLKRITDVELKKIVDKENFVDVGVAV